MTSRERVKRAMHFQSVDKVPVRLYYCPVGYYEHGDKLNDLYAALPGDFKPFMRMPVPELSAADFDEQGNYHTFKTDDWGVVWEYRIFGIAGIPYRHPVTCPEEAAAYKAPVPPALEGEGHKAFADRIREHKESGYYTLENCGELYQRLTSLYAEENVLCDVALGEPEIEKLADEIMAYNSVLLERAMKAGVDCIFFGDDYGTERSLLMSPDTWRGFFKPRLREFFQPAVAAGLDIHFHSCGQVWDILEDLKEIGVTSIWPQLPVYDMQKLARRCRELRLAVEVHTDRANTMTYGTPHDVRELVKREFDAFGMMDGGAWFYVEADNGFPFENLEALVEAIALYR